jgi:hypothetical protein
MKAKDVTASDVAALTLTATASAGVSATASASGVQVFQFTGLLWATEYNARAASEALGSDLNAQTVHAMNTLLMSYAALQALVLETALIKYPNLYAQKQEFRRRGVITQIELYLEADGRKGEGLPDVVREINEHRHALTHSEPDNVRSAVLGEVISGTDAARFAKEIRNVAEWLWQGRRPGAVAQEFDKPNGLLDDKQQKL